MRALVWPCLVLLSATAVCPAADALLGPVQEVSVVDDFSAGSQKAWQATDARNVEHELRAGCDIPGVASSVMQVTLRRKSPADGEAGHNWFGMKRAVPAGALGKDADGIRLLIGVPNGGKWWTCVSLRVGHQSYSHIVQPIYPARMMVEHVIPFEQFKGAAGPLSREEAARIDGIGLDFSVSGTTLYLGRISAYRQERLESWLSFASAHPNNNIFEPGQPVLVTLTPGGTLPATAKAFRYEVSDFFQHVTACGTVALDGAPSYPLDLTPRTHGYYELRAYWLDAAGKDLEPRSCIHAEGTLPAGMVTFAVMPHTSEQNIARFKSLGTNAFFGLHGDFMNLADLMGLIWRFSYTQWRFLEPSKPERVKGLAPWAAKRIASEQPQPSWRPHILPFCANLGAPDWAGNPAKAAPPFTNWDDYLAVVRDYVAVEKHAYPEMNPRIYGVAWEINLNMPPYNLGVPYTPADVVELHRRVRETIKSADPGAMVIGPCESTLNAQWMEEIFKAGLLPYVDGIESHGYAEDVLTPEENHYPERLAAIKDLMRRYNHGRVLPIYVTEASFKGLVGSQSLHRQQAQVMTRLAIILKGEGVRVFLPFFGIDYDRNDRFGFCFNLEVDGEVPFATTRISPKPTVNAMATCAGVLEGAAPVRRVEGLGENVWAYLFERRGTPILAIWAPAAAQRISVPVLAPTTGGKTIEAVDIMGHSSKVPVVDGRLALTIDQSPQYLIGVSPGASSGHGGRARRDEFHPL